MPSDLGSRSLSPKVGQSVRKLATPLVMLGLAVVLMGAGAAAAGPADGAAPHVFTDSGMTLQLSSSMPGVTFSGNTLVCPPMLITTSSGENLAACAFTISSTGAVAPSSLAVTMTASGITPAQAAAHKFAIAPQPGPLAYFGTTSQTIYTLTGAQLPATVNPGVVWGANAGGELGNSDLGATIVVTYTVVAETLEGATGTPGTPVASGTPVATKTPVEFVGGATGTPVATKTPVEFVGGATGAPGQTATPPPTVSTGGPSHNDSSPLFALLICFLLGLVGLTAVKAQRRTMRR